LDDAHACADQIVCQVGRAGEVIGDTAKADRHFHASSALGRPIPGNVLITALSSSRP
jgi:hypothetical protein